MEQDKLDEILKKHKLWLDGDEKGPFCCYTGKRYWFEDSKKVINNEDSKEAFDKVQELDDNGHFGIVDNNDKIIYRGTRLNCMNKFLEYLDKNVKKETVVDEEEEDIEEYME